MDPHDLPGLPVLPVPPGVDPPALEASRKVVELYLSTGTTTSSIKDLAARVGVSERTFYRYFPRKEDSVRPYLSAALTLVVDQLRAAARDRPLSQAIAESQGDILDLARRLEVRRLLAVLSSTDRLRAVWLQVNEDAERAFAEVVAEARGLCPGSTEARLVGAAIVASGRLALQAEERLPSEVFAECVDLLGGGLFERRSG